jgi:hypothetical protein
MVTGLSGAARDFKKAAGGLAVTGSSRWEGTVGRNG